MADIKVEIRTNNVMYHCQLCDKYFNADSTDKKFYGIGCVQGIAPQGNGQFAVMFGSLIVCEDCWKDNTGGKGYNFKEPSGIVTPTFNTDKVIKDIHKLGITKN